MFGLLDPAKSRQNLVYPAKAQVSADERKADRRLAQQRGEQGGVRVIHAGQARLRHGHVGAHREHPAPVRARAIEGSFLLTADT